MHVFVIFTREIVRLSREYEVHHVTKNIFQVRFERFVNMYVISE